MSQVTTQDALDCKKTIQAKNHMEKKYGFEITTEEYMILKVMSRRDRRKALLGKMKAFGQNNTNKMAPPHAAR